VADDGRTRATYDAVAVEYDRLLAGELAAKPLDRALLRAASELAAGGPLADVGCGPGHVTRFLAEHHPGVVGVDLSPAMVALAREHAPQLTFVEASMLDLPVPDDAWAGAVALYSVIHFDAPARAAAFAELARVLRPGGVLLVAFHVDSPEFATGEVNHLTTWFGQPVDLDGYFLAPDVVAAELHAAGLAVTATVLREPIDGAEYPSRRCYLVARS
jgi:ubiquinone/menaquinone biosynthesis C-methylase UbiE